MLFTSFDNGRKSDSYFSYFSMDFVQQRKVAFSFIEMKNYMFTIRLKGNSLSSIAHGGGTQS